MLFKVRAVTDTNTVTYSAYRYKVVTHHKTEQTLNCLT